MRLLPCLRICALALIAAIPATAAQTPSDKEIALRFTPPELTADVPDDRMDELEVVAEKADLDHSGSLDYLVAGYCGRQTGALLVIRLNPAPAVVATSDARMGGRHVKLKLVDVERDGKPEIFATFSDTRGPGAGFLFKWQSGKLVLLSDEIPGGLFEDVDGDGILDMVGNASRGTMGSPLYQLIGGKFTYSRQLVLHSWLSQFESPSSEEFKVPYSGWPYVLRVINADSSGANPIKGEILLNGERIVSAADLVKPGLFSIPISVHKSNVLVVKTDGPEHGKLIVTIVPSGELWVPKVIPFTECVWDNGKGHFTASFGYENPGEETVMASSNDNLFTPEPWDPRQPGVFETGRHEHAFWSRSEGETLTWSLNGTVVKASLASPRCKGPSPVPTNEFSMEVDEPKAPPAAKPARPPH
jgi:hypothetical protein